MSMKQAIQAISALRKYADIQEELCYALLQNHSLLDRVLLTDLPIHGILSVGNDLWEYEKHGKGVCFKCVSNGDIVDVPTGLTVCSRGLDAWRIALHFSLGEGIKLKHKDLEYDATEQAIEKLLKRLCDDGVLKIFNYPGVGALYVAPDVHEQCEK